MRATAKLRQPENGSVTTNRSGNTSEEHEEDVVENNRRDEKEKETKENEERRIKPLKFKTVTRFCTKTLTAWKHVWAKIIAAVADFMILKIAQWQKRRAKMIWKQKREMWENQTKKKVLKWRTKQEK